MASNALAREDRREWAAACDVQQRFMRHAAPTIDALDYSAKCRQMHELGGDFCDFVPLAGGRLMLAVGDASGKGLAGALMVSNVQSSLRTAALLAGDGGPEILTAVNRQVYATSLPDRYATLFYGVLDVASRTLRYVNAGHNPPIVLRRDGSVDWLETGGAPVGMFADWCYEEGVVELHAGDLVLSCTDGVIETENPFGQVWGVEGLQQAATSHRDRSADKMVDAIFKSMDEFSRGCQTDDATLSVVRVQ